MGSALALAPIPSGTRSIEYDYDEWTLDSEAWTSGLLDGFSLDRDADARGRRGSLEVKAGGSRLYKATLGYCGESEQQWSSPGLPRPEPRGGERG